MYRSHQSSSKCSMKALLSFLNRGHRKRMHYTPSNSGLLWQSEKPSMNSVQANIQGFSRSKVVHLWSKYPVLSLSFLPRAFGWHNQQGCLCSLSSAWLYINELDSPESSVLVCKWCWGSIALQGEVRSDMYRQSWKEERQSHPQTAVLKKAEQ